MRRISSSMEQQDFLYFNRLNESAKNRVDGQLHSQKRIALLRDDPAAAAHSIRFQSKAARLERYSYNIENAINRYSVAEGNMAEATELLQRIRELAVQGANGIYTDEDLRYMGQEVNQYLEQLVTIANQKGADGMALFAGTRSNANAFHAIRSSVEGIEGLAISHVEYTGNSQSRTTEYADGFQIDTQFLGNKVFWAENQHIVGGNQVNEFVVRQDSKIVIDNIEIEFKAGDSALTVAERINRADVAVQASLDPVENTMTLKTTIPHQLWLDDIEDGTVLADLGLISTIQKAPNNYSNNARVHGGSMFDAVIQLRDALFAGDKEKVGGLALGGIDEAFSALNFQRSELGSRQSRMGKTLDRASYETIAYKQWDDQMRGLDFAEAVTEMNMIQTALQASYRSASSLMRPTLMDFLK